MAADWVLVATTGMSALIGAGVPAYATLKGAARARQDEKEEREADRLHERELRDADHGHERELRNADREEQRELGQHERNERVEAARAAAEGAHAEALGELLTSTSKALARWVTTSEGGGGLAMFDESDLMNLTALIVQLRATAPDRTRSWSVTMLQKLPDVTRSDMVQFAEAMRLDVLRGEDETFDLGDDQPISFLNTGYHPDIHAALNREESDDHDQKGDKSTDG